MVQERDCARAGEGMGDGGGGCRRGGGPAQRGWNGGWRRGDSPRESGGGAMARWWGGRLAGWVSENAVAMGGDNQSIKSLSSKVERGALAGHIVEGGVRLTAAATGDRACCCPRRAGCPRRRGGCPRRRVGCCPLHLMKRRSGRTKRGRWGRCGGLAGRGARGGWERVSANGRLGWGEPRRPPNTTLLHAPMRRPCLC